MQNVLLKAAGLYSFPNRLASVPSGALLKANNIIINRDNIIESRRGFKLYGTAMGSGSATTAHQLMTYKGRVLRHFGAASGTTIDFDNGSGTFTSFSGTYSEVTEGLRIKSIESNGNFYFTTTAGIKKLSVSSASGLSTATITNAGTSPALDVQATLNPQTGFFEQESVIAYRQVWGIIDANNNEILGAPSSRTIIYNPLTDLLIKDFNQLLFNLDSLNVSTGINAQNYVTSFKVAANSPASTLRSNLISLTSAIDNDIPPFTSSGSPTVTGTGPYSVEWTVTTDPTTVLTAGDAVSITGVNPTTFNVSGTVTNTSSTTITYSQTTDPGIYVSGTATIKRINYSSITQPIALSTSPTTDQLLSTQNYYSTIVSYLQNEPVGVVTGTPFTLDNATTSATVNLKFPIPAGITTAYFYQIYRTAQTTSSTGITLTSLDPGDEEQLVFEDNPTSTDLSNGYVIVQDITPDSFRGANLYTNPNTGEGILQANTVPPLAKDVASFKNYIFYADTTTKHRLNLSMLSDIDFVSGTSTITITDGTTTNTYTFVSGVAKSQTVTTVADVAGSLNSKYFTLWSGKNQTKYYIWFSNGTGIDPAVSNATGIKVTYVNNDSANTIAALIKTALNRISDFTVTVLTNVVTITNTTKGIATSAANGAASPGFSYAVTIAGAGEDATNKKILISSLSTPAQQVDECARSLVRVINSNSAEIVYAFYLSGENDIPGMFLFEAKNLGQNTFYLGCDSTTTGNEFSPAITPTNSITSITVANPTVVTSALHGLNNGDTIIIYGSNSTPSIDGINTVSNIATNTFTVPVNVTVSGNTGKFIKTSSALKSTNEALPNRIYYSKFQQPEAVPIVNTIDVGPQDKKILRILALRDNLFVLKEEGIYRISGQNAPFTVSLFDSSTNLKAPDSAAILNNLIYMFSTQGIATISDTGVSIISRPIEDELLKLTSVAYTNFNTATFGVGYESDRSYNVWTLTNSTDSFATQCFKYNTFTNCWTKNNLTARSGIINFNDDLFYIGPTDTNFISQERKNFNRTDYSDREFTVSINPSSVNGTDIVLSTLNNISIGDVFLQTQYLTLKEFNRLLSKLDNDTKLTTNYVTNYTAAAGDALYTDLDNLITAIANDLGRLSVSGHTSAATYTALIPTSSTFSSIQTNYNNLINLLNADLGTYFKNYMLSSGTTTYEFSIISLDTTNTSISSAYSYPIIEGPATIYNHINCETQWVPQYMQDVSMSKHFSESTVIFEDSSFSTASISFSSDLSANFEDQTIPGLGNGIYGNFVYGTAVYGGNGAAIPFRTLIPREKQRARYLNVLFEHAIAREVFSLYGISITYVPVSQRAYR